MQFYRLVSLIICLFKLFEIIHPWMIGTVKCQCYNQKFKTYMKVCNGEEFLKNLYQKNALILTKNNKYLYQKICPVINYIFYSIK